MRLGKQKRKRDGSIDATVSLIKRGDYKVSGYRYPFQEGTYWLNRDSRNAFASPSNSNRACKDIVKSLYKSGAILVLIPGTNGDDYSDQIYIMPGNNEDETKILGFINSNLRSATIFIENLHVRTSKVDAAGPFIIADWSSSARHDSEFRRAFRYREDLDE